MCGEMCNVWRAVVCMTQLLWHQSPLAALAVDLPLLKHTPPRQRPCSYLEKAPSREKFRAASK